MEKLRRDDPQFFSKISQMRKVKSGGKTFMDKEIARAAQKKGVQSRLLKAAKRAERAPRIKSKDPPKK